MASTPRELVYQTVRRERPARAPRNLWALPIAEIEHPGAVAAIRAEFPMDMTTVPGHEAEPPPTRGNPHEVGRYVDEWGCVFDNVQRGIIGEVKRPLVADWETDTDRVHVPTELLTLDREAINRDCAATDLFVSPCHNISVFERIQWIRGPEMLYMDLADPPAAMLEFLQNRLHRFNCDLIRAWCQTDIDKVNIFDDWGSQRSLLISPTMWRELFKPLYREYVQLAHAAGKLIFMHSDGYILDIYEDLIEIGIDAVNSQIFCMGVERLEPFAGRITFWGEIDRQRLLPFGTPDEVAAAVRDVHARLWRDGGCIAQCEFSGAAQPPNVRAVFATWDELTAAPA